MVGMGRPTPRSRLVVAVTADAVLDHRCDPGPASPLIRRLLAFNRGFSASARPVDVVLLACDITRRDRRVRDAARAQGVRLLPRAGQGACRPWHQAQALDVSLFLSAEEQEVRRALAAGVPAGHVQQTPVRDSDSVDELTIAFDFDGVLADDTAESLFQLRGLDAFHASERAHAHIPLTAGPIARFFRDLARLRRQAVGRAPRIRTAVVTSRGTPAHTRVMTSLRTWGLEPDEAFFLGGQPKAPVLALLGPHIYFDDQRVHIEQACAIAPCAHVPFGVMNSVVENPALAKVS